VGERQQLAAARAAALQTAASRALSFGEVLQRKLGRARAPWACRMARGAAGKAPPSQQPIARRPVPVLAARALPVALPPAAVQDGAAPPMQQRRKRARLTEAQKLVLCASHDGRQGLSKARAADDLLGQLSAVERWWMLGGDPGVSAVPGREDQDRILRALILSKAGPSGDGAGKALKALREARAFAAARGVNGAWLPATAAWTALLLMGVADSAAARGKGSRGGASVAPSVRSGLLLLRDMRLPIEVDEQIAEAAVPPAVKVARVSHAGSFPVQLYFHWRILAAECEMLGVSTFARSWGTAGLLLSLRLVDTLRARYVAAPPMADGTPVIGVATKFSKDGAPIDVYAPAEDPSGPLPWWPDHFRAFHGKPFALPAMEYKHRHTGDPRFAVALRERVMDDSHARIGLRVLLQMPPLCLSDAEMAELHLTGHSAHGSPSDLMATIGRDAAPPFAFSPTDENEAGHWRRLDRSGALSVVERPAYGAEGERPPAGPAATDVAPAQAADMWVRYTSGPERVGRRSAQCELRRRLWRALAEAVRRFGRPPSELPRGRDDYCVLRLLAGEPAPGA
jgi:hypothetical protein